MKSICLLVLFVVFVSCSPYSESDREYMDFMEYQIRVIKDKYGLSLYSLGGFNEEGLKGYSLGFRSNAKMDVDLARAQIVNVMEDLFSNGNAYFKNLGKNELVRNQYDVSIVYLDNSSGLFYTSDIGLAEVSSYFGKIRYIIEPPASNRLETLFMEPYSEAYEKVMGQKFVESATQNSIN